MNGLSVRHGTIGDLPEVLAILNGQAAVLHRRGLAQWGYGFGPDRIGPPLEAGRTFLVERAGDRLAVATVTVSPEGNTAFWTSTELAEPAWYVSKLATAPWATDVKGLGGLVLRWVVDQAAQAGIPLVRADVWLDNHQLRDWYVRQGWVGVRADLVPGHKSGALFQCQAATDFEARAVLAGPQEWLIRMTRPPLSTDDPVRLDDGSEGVIAAVYPPRTDQREDGVLPEFPVRSYQVQLPGGVHLVCTDDQIIPL